jgi:hypothetical protein
MTAARRLLTSAPELALVEILDHVLRTTLVVLAVEHPTLADDDDRAPPQSLFHARRLVRRTIDLRDALERYRDAVVDAAERPLPIDDIPF